MERKNQAVFDPIMSRPSPPLPLLEQPCVIPKKWLLLILVLLSLTLPFIDVSRVISITERDVIKTHEREGPFLVTDSETGHAVEVDRRPELYNLTGPLHIIKSRFMQHQPGLQSLGWARFKMFKYICYPSMVAQTSQNFVWLVYTDPRLGPTLLQHMTRLLSRHAHFYLIQDNTEARFKGGSDLERLDWEDVVTGDARRLRYMLQQRDRFPFLETRIDADDGLHVRFVELVQEQAMTVLHPERTHWTYWCISQALEWHWVGHCGVSDDQNAYGALLPSRRYENYCHTPGMTLGLYRADENTDVLNVAHSRLWSTLDERRSYCGPRTYGTDCIRHIQEFRFAALRARTPTSASMVGVNKQPIEFLQAWDDERRRAWYFARRHFNVNRQGCKGTLRFLEDNMAAILEDAEVGQCTEGHSCRVSGMREQEHHRPFLDVP